MEHTTTNTTERTFDTPGPVRLRVELTVGDVTARAGSRSVTVVRLIPRGPGAEELLSRFTVEQRGSEILVEGPKARGSILSWGSRSSVDVEVELPERSDLNLSLGSGDVTATGVFARVVATAGSGDINVDEMADGDLKSGSGDITAGAVRGPLDVKTGSGDVSIETAGADVGLVSGSGDLWVGRAEAGLKAKTGSGDITVGASVSDLDVMTGTGDVSLRAIHAGEIRAKTGTGDLTLGVVTGVAAYLDLNSVTGEVKVDLDETAGPDGAEATAALRVQSGSGDIRIKRAQGSLS